VGGALAMGARHGAVCVGCCWALMALMLGFGAMNLLWMAALGLVMLAEKTLPGADRAARPLGAAAIAAGAALITTTLF
jgi:predicted metal-binding membrane protein